MSKKLSWTTEKRKVKDLTPLDSNPREITDRQYKDLLDSITKFDLVEIPVIDKDKNNTLIAGHQRVNVLISEGRGEETIEVRVPNRKLTHHELREYNLRSNKNRGKWNWDELANYDENLLRKVGFTGQELKKLFQLDEKLEAKEEFSREVLEENNYVMFVFNDSVDWNFIKENLGLKAVLAGDSKDGYKRKGIGRVLDGQILIDLIKEDQNE